MLVKWREEAFFITEIKLFFLPCFFYQPSSKFKRLESELESQFYKLKINKKNKKFSLYNKNLFLGNSNFVPNKSTIIQFKTFIL